MATWAETATVLAADLMAGNEDPRPHAAELLGRALAALPAPARAGRIRLRADAGYFAGELARAALFAEVEFAIGARRIAPLWRILDGVAETDWTDAIDMADAQVAVADYCPDWWPAATRLLIRRVRARRRPPGRSPPTRGPGGAAPCTPTSAPCRSPSSPPRDAVYGYSFIVTNLDVSTGERAAAVEHWYRHRTQVENMFRDAKLGGRAAAPPLGISAGQHRVDVGCAARGQHRRLAAPAHRHPRTRAAGCSGTASAAAKP